MAPQPIKMFHPSSEKPADPQSAITYLRGYIDASPGNDVYADRCLQALVDAFNEPTPDIGQLAAEHTAAILEVAEQRKAWEELRTALAPLARVAVVLREDRDDHNLQYHFCRTTGEIVSFNLGELRALLVAAGLSTPDMLPAIPPQAAAPAEAAAVAPPPAGGSTDPADHGIGAADLDALGDDLGADAPVADGADASADGDSLRGQRMDSADVGEDAIDEIERDEIIARSEF